MKIVIVSENIKMLNNVYKSRHKFNKSYDDNLNIFAYNALEFPSEETILKMYEDVEESDIYILDITSDADPVMFYNSVFACISCKRYIIPCSIESSIRNLLRLGRLTAKDITSINPNYNIHDNYLSMVEIAKSIERQGKLTSGRLKDFNNYLKICDYVNKGDLKSTAKLLLLLQSEYGKIADKGDRKVI